MEYIQDKTSVGDNSYTKASRENYYQTCALENVAIQSLIVNQQNLFRCMN